MKISLLLHGLIEFIGAIVLMLYPSFFFLSNYSTESLLLLKMYSILGVTFGAISILLFRDFEFTSFFKKIYLIILAFQIFISFHLFSMYQSEVITHVGPVATHIGVMVILFIGYFKDFNKF